MKDVSFSEHQTEDNLDVYYCAGIIWKTPLFEVRFYPNFPEDRQFVVNSDPRPTNFGTLREALQWINEKTQAYERNKLAELTVAIDDILEFLDNRRDTDSEGCNREMVLYDQLSNARDRYYRALRAKGAVIPDSGAVIFGLGEWKASLK